MCCILLVIQVYICKIVGNKHYCQGSALFSIAWYVRCLSALDIPEGGGWNVMYLMVLFSKNVFVFPEFKIPRFESFSLPSNKLPYVSPITIGC